MAGKNDREMKRTENNFAFRSTLGGVSSGMPTVLPTQRLPGKFRGVPATLSRFIRPSCHPGPCEVSSRVLEGGRVYGRWALTWGLACGVVVLSPHARGLRALGQGTPDTSRTSARKETGAAAKLPLYDVVTIRPNNQGTGNVDIDRDINTYAGTNVSLLNLIHDAYDIQPDLVSGGPKWVEASRFDVRAKAVDTDAKELENLSREDKRRMLQVLLAERFHLRVHTEVKTLPVYELVVAKGGTRLAEVAPEHKDDPFQGASSGSTNIHNGNLTAAYRSMANFADTLSGQVHRTVLDKTGLPGHYNFQLSWTRDDVPAPESATAPPLFTALEEQLGLRLVPAKGPVTTLLIDHADLPAEDEN